ncbi:HhH-GPD-type base excision DNA repair protein [Kitasatospora sp. NPDC056076]|uniref:HhH-GPD-type base excision DNA repair protein n=1 Tax=Kitasatospora sp. NPDC056076 TaxID=3345703 RepID=UPI0035D9F75D
MDITVRIAQQPEADALLGRSALALLIGALLDRNMALERAFAAPLTIAHRLGRDDLDAQEIAFYRPERLAALFSARPAVHDSPALMARRVQEACRYLLARHGGNAAAVWDGAATGKELYARLNALPGFGRQKAQIFVALLGKQFGVQPHGWREAAGPYGEDNIFRSVADVTSPDALRKVGAFREQQRQTTKHAQTRLATTAPRDQSGAAT